MRQRIAHCAPSEREVSNAVRGDDDAGGGATEARDLPIPGRELKGVHFAMDYLTQQNKRNAGIPQTEEPITAKGKRVVIIGGGDTGSDCLGTTHRQGCVEVHQFELLPEPPPSRASSTPWPLWPMQLRTSHAHEEGCDRQWSMSTVKFTGHNGHVTKLHGQRVSFEGGKFIPIPNLDGVFAGGDTKRGASLIVWAIAEGRKMAAGIDKYLRAGKSAKKPVS